MANNERANYRVTRSFEQKRLPRQEYQYFTASHEAV